MTPPNKGPSLCSNIELFDQYAARVLSELYQSFPFEKDLIISELIKDSGYSSQIEQNPLDIVTGDESAKRRAELLEKTIEWLGQSRYLHYRNRQPYVRFTDVRLTAKALAVMKSPSDSLKQKQMLGDLLVKSVSSGAASTVKTILSQIISHGIQRFGMGG